MRNPPMASQLFVLAAVPAPLPNPTTSSRSIRRLRKYAGHVSQSRSRTEQRVAAYAPPRARKNQTSCVFHSRATAVGMSVWPAEYTMAMP